MIVLRPARASIRHRPHLPAPCTALPSATRALPSALALRARPLSQAAQVELPRETPVSPLLSVNIFPSRACNYECGFCFHTAKNSQKLSIEETRRGLEMLVAAGTEKVNIAGGEPFMRPRFLGKMVEHCSDLGLTVSIISNGSLIRRDWLLQFGRHVSVLGISCDSFDEATNRAIGRRGKRSRGDGPGQAEHALRVREWCDLYGIKYKLNTVVNSLNWEEDMNAGVARLDPFRWKVFQCLVLEGENSGAAGELRDATAFVVDESQFESFVSRHARLRPVREDNSQMRDSYVLIDERLRFLNCENGRKVPTQSILEVGVWRAFTEAGFDVGAFLQRGGVYDWS